MIETILRMNGAAKLEGSVKRSMPAMIFANRYDALEDEVCPPHIN
jgi:hypothetical protein